MALTCLTLLLLGLLPTSATHELHHRYFVSGTVLQTGGAPACGVSVQADGATGTTDYRGQYRILLHLHDSTVDPFNNDEGKLVTVTVVSAGVAQTTTALPGPAEDGWGESRVDLQVPPSIGGDCIAPVDPLVQGLLFVGLPLLLVAGLGFAYVKVIRPRRGRRSRTPALSSLPGVGKGRLKEFSALGITTLEDLARASPTAIAQGTSIGKREAMRLVRRARESLEE